MRRQASLRVDEVGDEIVRRSIAQIGERAVLHDAAFVHQDNAIAEISRFREIVRDENRGLLQARENFLQVLLQAPRARADRARRAVRRAKAIPARARERASG